MKPQLASDIDFAITTWPKMALPKIDGVRSLHTGTFHGRSLKPFTGYGLNQMFGSPDYMGIDGELIVGNNPTAENLCSDTSGAVSAFKGVTETADFNWYVFDYLKNPHLPYQERYAELEKVVQGLRDAGHHRIHLVPMFLCKSEEQARSAIEEYLSQGFEGVIFRNPDAPAKPGRPGKNSQEYLRYKPWMDSECLVTEILEGSSNTNEAVTNPLGRTERSTAKEGMIPNGMVGSMKGTLLEDIVSPITGKTLFPKGLEITVSRGKMTAAQCRYYFENPQELVGSVVKFQHMAFGTQDFPRFPGYLSHRVAQDRSPN